MKKFILGYIIGGVLSSIATEYYVKSQLYIKLTQKYNTKKDA